MRYIGIDFHKKNFTVCYRRPDSDEAIEEFETSDEGIERFLETVTCFDQVAIEAIGFCRFFVKRLQPKVADITLVHAPKNLLITKSNKKTDAHDASMLAYGLEHGLLPKARFRSEAAQQIRSMIGARQMLVMTRVRVVNYLSAITSRNGQLFEKEQLLYKLWRDRICLESLDVGDTAAVVVLEQQMSQLHRDILELKKKIERACMLMPGYDVLASIPGFGPIRRASLLVTIDRIEDFNSPKKLCSFIGIVPRVKMSAGEHIPGKFGKFRSGAITREGDVRARTALIMATNKAISINASLRAFYDRIKARKGYRKARTAAARKLLVLIYFALKAGQPIDDFAMIDFAKPHKF